MKDGVRRRREAIGAAEVWPAESRCRHAHPEHGGSQMFGRMHAPYALAEDLLRAREFAL